MAQIAPHLQQELKSLLEGSLEKAVRQLMKSVRQDTEVFDDLTLEQARLTDIEKRFNKGLLEQDIYHVELNKIRESILMLINDLQEEDLSFGYSALEKAIASLGFAEPLGTLHLVNCNRDNEFGLFWTEFDREDAKPYQFYFLPACPKQQPTGFTERLIREIMYYKLNNEAAKGISYITNDRYEIGGKFISRIEIEPLPGLRAPILNLQITEFQKYFKKRFAALIGDLSLEAVIESQAVALQYQYVTFTFRMTAADWKKFTPQYFEWFITTFSKKSVGSPIFLFFFVIEKNDFHITPDNNILTALQTLESRYDEATMLIPSLPPVALADIEGWLNIVKSSSSSPLQLQNVMDLFVQNVRANDTEMPPGEAKHVNMVHVEELQKTAYIVSNQLKTPSA